jgi:GAF domain-containing protein
MNLLSACFKDQLIGSPNEIAILDHVAECIRQHVDARYASAQLFNPALKNLHLVVYREFTKALIDQFDDVPIPSGTVCARAARHRVPILIPDVTTDAEWTPYLSFSEEAGFHGVLSLPLLSRTGELLGVSSCHFAGLAKPTETELNFASVCCKFASDAIVELRRRRAGAIE